MKFNCQLLKLLYSIVSASCSVYVTLLLDLNALIDSNCAFDWIIWCWICKLPILKCRCTYETVFVFVLNLIVIARFPCFVFIHRIKMLKVDTYTIVNRQPQWILLKWIRWCFRKKKKLSRRSTRAKTRNNFWKLVWRTSKISIYFDVFESFSIIITCITNFD